MSRKLMREIELPLLPAQKELVTCTDFRVAFVGGYGSGKTFAGVIKTFQLGIANPKTQLIFVAPSYKLLEDVNVRSFTDFFHQYGIPFKLNKASMVMSVANTFDVLLRSGDRPELLVGVNASSVIIDEPAAQEEEVAKMLIGRIRDPKSKQRQIVLTGTPDGSGWFRNWAETDGTRRIHARTMDNPYLPEEYVTNLRAAYSAEEIKCYLEGEFVKFGGAWYSKVPEVIPHESWEGFKLFLRPEQCSDQLVIGVDTGGGLGRDSGAIAMVDKRDKRLVATWKDADATIDDMSLLVKKLTQKYSKTKPTHFPGLYPEQAGSQPVTVCEVNGIGRATYQVLIAQGVPAVELNTTEATRYQGLQAMRSAVSAGYMFGPEELKHEAENLQTEDGKFIGPKDLSMAAGFALRHIYANPYIVPVDPAKAKVLELTKRLGRRPQGW